MTTASEAKQDAAKKRARNLRYKKSLVRDLNWDSLISSLYEMQETVTDVQWSDRDQLIEILGDEEDADAFMTEFGELEADLERVQSDLEEYRDWRDEDFDDSMVTVLGANLGGGLIGYDAYETDYYGLESTYEEELAQKAAKARLMRKTKEDLIELYGISIRVIVQYEAVRYRFDCLKTAMDSIRDSQDIKRATLDEMEDLYEKCEREAFYDFAPYTKRFNMILDQLPADAWLR